MKIAVLNKSFLKEEHLEKLKKFGEVYEYIDTDSEEKIITRLKDIDVAIANCFLTPLNSNVFQSAKNLKYISLTSTGYDSVDIETARSMGIKISNLRSYSAEAVAEHAIALMFALSKKILLMNKKVRHHPHEMVLNNNLEKQLMGFNLKDKTIGIIGLGAIGQRTAQISNGIGMKVISYNYPPREFENVEMVSLPDLLKRSDVISLHVPLTKETENIISEKEFNLMKPNAIIINTARGKIINEKDLYSALISQKISGAGLDTLCDWSNSNPLLKLDNVIITPHVAWYTEESVVNLANETISNVEAFVNGNPINLIT